MSQINMTSITLFVLVLALTAINAQNECSGGSVNCISIRNCPQIMSILTDPKPLSAQMSETLRNAQCGFEGNDPKYCCNQKKITMTTTTTTTVEPEIEVSNPPDVTNHPNLRLLSHQACGPVPQQRQMIGSNKTEMFQYPWMAFIERNLFGKLFKFDSCSGTIIASRYVLTAASCTNGYRSSFRMIEVRIGVYDISKKRDCIENNEGFGIMCAERYQFFGIDEIHVHPQYNILTSENNIALIRLNGTVDFRSRNVKPICLPLGTAATLTHKMLIMTCWSRHSFYQELLQMKVPLVTNEQCIENYKDYIMKFSYKQLCTGTQEFEDSCISFSGGALQTAGIYNGESVRIILHAVVNYGLCLPGNLSVHTNVSYYMKWILDTMTD